MEKNILKSNTAHLTLHFIAYYVVWFICIYSSAKGHIWIGLKIAFVITALQFLWQYSIKKQTTHLLPFLIYLTVIGLVGDSFLTYIKMVSFSANPFIFPLSPPFMLGIWLNFAMLFYATLSWFITRPVMLGIFSFVGFTLAYLLGSTMGAAILIKGTLSLVVIGLLWTLLLPISIILFDRFLGLPRALT